MIRRLLSIVLCFAVLVSAAACAAPEKQKGKVVSSQVSSETAPLAFTFKAKVSSSFLEDVYGKKMCDSWFALVDAVLAGEDTFACPDSHVYFWMTQHFPDVCLPVLRDLVKFYDDSTDYPVKNGVGRFEYKVPKEEVAQKIKDFGKLVEGILNSVLKEDYSDFEKMLALYIYFTKNYEYDYESYYKLQKTNFLSYLSPYRLLTTKTGICCEIAQAYSYLLMQVGIDASTVTCEASGSDSHEWSIVKLSGKYYHIDPTFALGSSANMNYFLMNDKQRYDDGGFAKKNFEYVSIYNPENPPDYTSKDKTFSPLWKGWFESFDHDAKTVTINLFTLDEEAKTDTFSYEGY